MKTKLVKKVTSCSLFACALVSALACFGLSPEAQAVSPAPDGGYANYNTAEGSDALFSLTTGFDNTANGFGALASNITGYDNTANGFNALIHNTTGSNNIALGLSAGVNLTTGTHDGSSG